MTPSTPQQALPALPAAVPSPPVFGAAPQGKKPGAKNPTPTFLGAADMASPANLGGKQLVGQ
jgi:hypothetical protein